MARAHFRLSVHRKCFDNCQHSSGQSHIWPELTSDFQFTGNVLITVNTAGCVQGTNTHTIHRRFEPITQLVNPIIISQSTCSGLLVRIHRVVLTACCHMTALASASLAVHMPHNYMHLGLFDFCMATYKAQVAHSLRAAHAACG